MLAGSSAAACSTASIATGDCAAVHGVERRVVEGRLAGFVERELHGRLEGDLGIGLERDRLVPGGHLESGRLDRRARELGDRRRLGGDVEIRADDRLGEVRCVEREIGPVRHLEQRGLGFGQVGFDRRRIRRWRPSSDSKASELVGVGAGIRGDWHIEELGHETQLGVEHERRVVAQGAVDETLHARADDAPGDDEVGVGGGDADAGAGADEQARIALEQDAAVREVDEVDLRIRR